MSVRPRPGTHYRDQSRSLVQCTVAKTFFFLSLFLSFHLSVHCKRIHTTLRSSPPPPPPPLLLLFSRYNFRAVAIVVHVRNLLFFLPLINYNRAAAAAVFFLAFARSWFCIPCIYLLLHVHVKFLADILYRARGGQRANWRFSLFFFSCFKYIFSARKRSQCYWLACASVAVCGVQVDAPTQLELSRFLLSLLSLTMTTTKKRHTHTLGEKLRAAGIATDTHTHTHTYIQGCNGKERRGPAPVVCLCERPKQNTTAYDRTVAGVCVCMCAPDENRTGYTHGGWWWWWSGATTAANTTSNNNLCESSKRGHGRRIFTGGWNGGGHKQNATSPLQSWTCTCSTLYSATVAYASRAGWSGGSLRVWFVTPLHQTH